MPETTTDSTPTKKNGAPLKNAPGRVPYHEVDRLLVFGELVDGPEGEPPFVVYPSFRDLHLALVEPRVHVADVPGRLDAKQLRVQVSVPHGRRSSPLLRRRTTCPSGGRQHPLAARRSGSPPHATHLKPGSPFMIERKLANAPPKKRKVERNKRSRPIVDAFFAWCEQTKAYALDDSPLAKGLTYALNQRKALRRFLADGRLPIHNNASEIQLRRQAVGRKNWLFIASEAGALANTTFVTLLASCQMHGIEPQGYLRDVLCLLPG